jgi:TonB family protein
MKIKSLVIATALVVGLFSASAYAYTSDAIGQGVQYLQAPVPIKIVSPTGLPYSLKGETVTLLLTIDAAGQPHNIKIVIGDTPMLRRSLVAAVSQWQFTPALRNGVPVSTKIVMPLRLEEAGS